MIGTRLAATGSPAGRGDDGLHPRRQHRLPRLPPGRAALLGADQLGEGVAYDVGGRRSRHCCSAASRSAPRSAPRAGSGGAGERSGAFLARNLPLYAGILALVAPDSLAPDVLVDISRIVVVAILPVGFFAVGTALAQESDEGGEGSGCRRRSSPGERWAWWGRKVLLLPALLYAISNCR